MTEPTAGQSGWQRRVAQLRATRVGKRLRDVVRLHLRQLPCLHSIVDSLRCWKRTSYQSLEQDEEGDGTEVEDKRQDVNLMVGRILVKVAVAGMVGLTALFVTRNNDRGGERNYQLLSAEEEFARDSPIIMYLAALEVLVCGACCHTASQMYRRRRPAIRHPAESTGRERQGYIKVELQKDAGLEHRQFFGLGFRPSTDGLECLIVEAVRPGSLLEQWNQQATGPSAEQLVEEALGEEKVAEDPPATAEAGEASSSSAEPPLPRIVAPGAAVVAVNEATADVGLMQVQLLRPKVTIWLHSHLIHPSQMESDVFNLGATSAMPGSENSEQPQQQGTVSPAVLGRPDGLGQGQIPTMRTVPPKCACMALEDEEQQILTRWTVCAIIFGWVTILPVLLMQPHEQRPRQQLFRQFLMKPCIITMPVALLLWLVDSAEVMLQYEIIRPFIYFCVSHVLIPGILIYYLVQMQAADENLVLEQRRSRLTEVAGALPVVAEDPAPTLFKELIEINPVALVLLGASSSIPLVISSLLTPLQTKRGKKAQGYVHIVYGPCAFLQVGYLWVLWHVRFIDLPRLYLTSLGLLLSVPCLLIWCFCLLCAARYGREDLAMVERQRQERAKEALQAAGIPVPEAVPVPGEEESLPRLVDCSQAASRDWELIYTA